MRSAHIAFAILAAAGLAAAAETETQTVRSIRYENFKRVTLEQIVDRLREREVPLEKDGAYRPEFMDLACRMLQQLLVEHGERDAQVEVWTRTAPEGGVELLFRNEAGAKKRAIAKR